MPPSPRLLVAEDDRGLLLALRELLVDAGYQVDATLDGAEAARLLGERAYDAVILDIQLPNRNGLEILAEAASRPEVTPAILITGSPSTDGAVEALRRCAVDYIVKPFDVRYLLARVAQALEQRRRAARLEDARTRLEELERVLRALRADVLGSTTPAGSGHQDQANAHGPSAAREAHGTRAALPREVEALLTARERDIVRELMGGKRVPEIAATLGISPHTARNHFKAIFQKLGVQSQVALLSRVSIAVEREKA